MDFVSFQEAIASKQCAKWSPRRKYLDSLNRALYGELYEHIKNAFSREFSDSSAQKRISLDDRRASVQYRLSMMIARDLSTRLFGESGRPALIVRNDDYTNAWIQSFIEDTFIWLLYIDGAWQGSIGSHCIVTRVLAEEAESDVEDAADFPADAPGRFFHEIWPADECQPVFKRTSPHKLLEVTRTYESSADTLRADGYDVDKLEKKWRERKFGKSKKEQKFKQIANGYSAKTSSEWVLRIVLDAKSELWFEPIPKWLYEHRDFDEATEWDVDTDRSFDHDLGETPAIWFRALPTRHGNFPDGASTFEAAIDYQFRIDRTLSQTGRAFDYVGDPQLAIKAGSGSSQFGEELNAPEATASDIVEIEPDGDASFLEIRGEGLDIAIKTYVETLRKIAREVCAASRIDPESSPREMSGTAMKMLEHALFGVVGILRVSNGDMGLLPHIRMCMRIAKRVKVELPSLVDKLAESSVADSGEPNSQATIEMQWPALPEPSGQDKLAEVQAITAATSSATGVPIISQETATGNAAALFDVRDSGKEFAAIQGQMKQQQADDLAQQDASAAIAAKHEKPKILA